MAPPPPAKTVAIYCRKSTEDGLDQEFNSLDAQRQCCEQFAASQRHDGWVVSPEVYDDGGFSGSNTERPALQRLLAEVEAGRVQIIAVYKLDRLSRSLIDFVQLLQVLERRGVAFVSVTQHFNTATPMGRLMLNILICFAQFERENMIERVRDKVAATKRLGKWCGGRPILGYDVAPGGRKLVVNETEAAVVRELFALYQEHGSLAVVTRLAGERGHTNKRLTAGNGRVSGGKPFAKSVLGRLLGSIIYSGRIRYRGEIIAAEHPAIIDLATWERTQTLLATKRRRGGPEARTKHFPLLKGLLRCKACGCGLTYSYSKRGNRLYGYYVCANARVQGTSTCPMPSLPAAEVEQLAVGEIAAICRDPALAERVIREAQADHERARQDLEEQVRAARTALAQAEQDRALAPKDATALARLWQAEADLAESLRACDELRQMAPDRADARRLLQRFEPLWAELSPREQQALLHHLVAAIVIDGEAGSAAFSFRAGGIAALAQAAEGAP